MQKFVRTLSKNDFGVSGTLSVSSSDYQKIAELTVPAQQLMTWGANEVVNGGLQGSPAQIVLKNSTPAVINGVIRLVLADANEVRKIVVLEERTEKFGASAYDRTQAILIPEFKIKAKQDSKLIIEFKPDSDDTIDWSQSTIILPTTQYL